ncbi:MAG: antitoxin [Thermoleophilia bacterium]
MATTIRVSETTRDRLRGQAAERSMSIGEYLTWLADEQARRDRFAALRRAIRATSPDERTSYERETEAWERRDAVDWPTDE